MPFSREAEYILQFRFVHFCIFHLQVGKPTYLPFTVRNCCGEPICRFPRVGVPQIIHLNRIFPDKPSILGYPHGTPHCPWRIWRIAKATSPASPPKWRKTMTTTRPTTQRLRPRQLRSCLPTIPTFVIEFCS